MLLPTMLEAGPNNGLCCSEHLVFASLLIASFTTSHHFRVPFEQ
jgi:hypothetical protein